MVLRSRERFLFIINLILFIATPTFAQNYSDFKIGVILPLSGDAAFWGTNPKNGIELAIEDLSEKNKSNLTSTLFIKPEIIFEDDACDPKKAVTAFKKLTEVDKVDVILGPACSSCSLAVSPLAEKSKIPLFVFSEADSLTNAGDFVFRLWIPNGRQAKNLAKFIFEEKKLKRVALISIKNAYGEDFSKIFSKEFTLLGGEILAQEEYSSDDSKPRSQLIKIKNKSPEALIMASYIADGANIIKLAKNLNVAPNIFASSTINSPDFYKQTIGASENLIFFDIADITNEDFKKRWEGKFHQPWPGMQSGGSIFYDFTKFLLLAVDQYRQNSQPIKDYFSPMKSFNGISMTLNFDQSGDLIGNHSPFIVKNSSPIRFFSEAKYQ